MTSTLLSITIMVVMAALATIFCQPDIAPEIRRRMYDSSLRVLTLSRKMIYTTWCIVGIIAIALCAVANQPKVVPVISIMGIILTAVCSAVAHVRRANYFTADDERLTFYRHQQVEWSYRWDEIRSVRRRVVTTGKVTAVFLDLTTKSGIVHHSLPITLLPLLRSHVIIERRRPSVVALIILAILLAAICFALIAYYGK